MNKNVNHSKFTWMVLDRASWGASVITAFRDRNDRTSSAIHLQQTFFNGLVLTDEILDLFRSATSEINLETLPTRFSSDTLQHLINKELLMVHHGETHFTTTITLETEEKSTFFLFAHVLNEEAQDKIYYGFFPLFECLPHSREKNLEVKERALDEFILELRKPLANISHFNNLLENELKKEDLSTIRTLQKDFSKSFDQIQESIKALKKWEIHKKNNHFFTNNAVTLQEVLHTLIAKDDNTISVKDELFKIPYILTDAAVLQFIIGILLKELSSKAPGPITVYTENHNLYITTCTSIHPLPEATSTKWAPIMDSVESPTQNDVGMLCALYIGTYFKIPTTHFIQDVHLSFKLNFAQICLAK